MAPGRGDTSLVLVTFDVDGTLLESKAEDANLLHKRAFSYVFKEVFGVDGSIDATQHHGKTDSRILVDVLEHYGVSAEAATAKLPELKAKMVEYVKSNSSQVKDGLSLLPGVKSLLELLAEEKKAVVGLVTGNLEEIGWLKMAGLGIQQYFSTPNFGGFGSDHMERGELVKIAFERSKTHFPGQYSRRVHVGDTPADVRAAEYGGAIAVGVCTGVFSRDELLAASEGGKAIILDDLEDQWAFLTACGLHSL